MSQPSVVELSKGILSSAEWGKRLSKYKVRTYYMAFHEQNLIQALLFGFSIVLSTDSKVIAYLCILYVNEVKFLDPASGIYAQELFGLLAVHIRKCKSPHLSIIVYLTL